jgi:hypothetical protein
LTRNAIVLFADGTYLELVALWLPTTNGTTCGAEDHYWSGGGLVDYCVASDALGIDARRPKEAGFDVDGPDEGGKRLPDGTEIW